jgi:nitroimidazol reductase NimA-like FMN-containing flavoprotein (pyridoxamine 5'-phosphate oxidase superfamily)
MTDDAWLEELSLEQCVGLLRSHSVGRAAVSQEGAPVILPVNYKVVNTTALWIAVRTRPGSILDGAPLGAALEVDEIDPVHHEGWSVLVRGTLLHVDPGAASFRERFDPEPWMSAERDSWLVLEPFAVTGRRLHAAATAWAFHVRAYL